MSKVDQITTDENGFVMIRYIKDDGQYHRTGIPPHVDIDRQITEVEVHLVSMHQTATKPEDRKAIKDFANKARVKALQRTIKK